MRGSMWPRKSERLRATKEAAKPNGTRRALYATSASTAPKTPLGTSRFREVATSPPDHGYQAGGDREHADRAAHD